MRYFSFHFIKKILQPFASLRTYGSMKAPILTRHLSPITFVLNQPSVLHNDKF